MSAAHKVIPIFIPQKACPYHCIYCNQFAIAGQSRVPSPQEADLTIQQYLATLSQTAEKRIAFFGGSFTGMSIPEQTKYLNIANKYLRQNLISGIQLSTRPDYITDEILDNLKMYGVTLIELGAQSLNNDILSHAGRGHTVEQVAEASQKIKEYGFQLGLQMMIGLPGDTLDKSMDTAKKIVNFGAEYTRIYPTLVVENTLLAKWFREGRYTPLSLEEAITWCKSLYPFFTEHHVTVLRVGLHPSEGLLSGKDYLAGPFHVSFKELVLSAIWKDKLLHDGRLSAKNTEITFTVNPSQINYFIGYNAENKKMLLEKFHQIHYQTDAHLSENEYIVS